MLPIDPDKLPSDDAKPVGNTIECCSCGEQTDEGLAHDAGWRWVTQHDGEANWLCGECVRREREGGE